MSYSSISRLKIVFNILGFKTFVAAIAYILIYLLFIKLVWEQVWLEPVSGPTGLAGSVPFCNFCQKLGQVETELSKLLFPGYESLVLKKVKDSYQQCDQIGRFFALWATF